MAPYSSVLAWEIHRQGNPVDNSPWGHREVDSTEQLSTCTHTHTHTHTHTLTGGGGCCF